jgi:predicted nucleic-acid-binding Zn-ribbon protein
MKSGKCVKCGSTNVRRSPRPKPRKPSTGAIPLGTPFGVSVLVQWYVCANCGYAEQYVVKDSDREKVRTKWKLATEPED